MSLRIKPTHTASATQGHPLSRLSMIREVRHLATTLGRLPRPEEVYRSIPVNRINAEFGGISSLLTEAKVRPGDFMPNQLLVELRNWIARNNHYPTDATIDRDPKMPAAVVYHHHLGGLRTALMRIGVAPATLPEHRLLKAIEQGQHGNTAKKIPLSQNRPVTAAQRIAAARARWEHIHDLMAEARKHQWSQDQFKKELNKISPQARIVFANITHPARGKRKPSVDLEVAAGVQAQAITGWTRQFESFCAEMGWPVVPEHPVTLEKRAARVVGDDRWKAIATLMHRAREGHWSADHFGAELHKVDAKVGTVFDAVTPSTPDNPITNVSLAQDLDIQHKTIGTWRERLIDFCTTMPNWNGSGEVIVPDATNLGTQKTAVERYKDEKFGSTDPQKIAPLETPAKSPLDGKTPIPGFEPVTPRFSAHTAFPLPLDDLWKRLQTPPSVGRLSSPLPKSEAAIDLPETVGGEVFLSEPPLEMVVVGYGAIGAIMVSGGLLAVLAPEMMASCAGAAPAIEWLWPALAAP